MAPAGAKTAGLLVLDKPVGITSRAAVDRALGWFPRGTRGGHAGTLDPAATGVLVLCLGTATRLAEYVQRMNKTYVATVRLGAHSDTDDAEGVITIDAAAKPPSAETVASVLQDFVGEIQQVPPAFSAAKVDGRRRLRSGPARSRGCSSLRGKSRSSSSESTIISIRAWKSKCFVARELISARSRAIWGSVSGVAPSSNPCGEPGLGPLTWPRRCLLTLTPIRPGHSAPSAIACHRRFAVRRRRSRHDRAAGPGTTDCVVNVRLMTLPSPGREVAVLDQSGALAAVAIVDESGQMLLAAQGLRARARHQPCASEG